jgi:uncharacterized protein
MPNRENIVASLRAIRPELEDQFPIRLVGLFGSVARDGADERSDIDVLAAYRPGLSLFKLGAAEAMLKRALGMNVDLVLEGSLKPAVRRRIEKDLIPL